MILDLFASDEGNTPLSHEEQEALIPDLSSREELNQWERQNILIAAHWTSASNNLQAGSILTDDYVRELHRRMFNETWKWAGAFRTSEKNIGVPHYRIREELAVLLGDVRYWLKHRTYDLDEAAIRFHHRLVAIHCFPNGNGRHARLAADALALSHSLPVFTWGSENSDMVSISQTRTRYLQALRAADANDIHPLLIFARS